MPKTEPMELVGGNTITPPSKETKTQRTSQRIKHFMTWNNYKKSDIEKLKKKMDSICKVYVFQEETGENGTPHLQGCFWLHKKARWTEFNLSKKIHWEKVINWKQSVEYCSKEETRSGNVYSKGITFPKKLKLIEKLRPWQKDILKIIESEPDDRTVYWIYDQKGCNGKTVFSKYLHAKENAIIATAGGNKDIACLLAVLKEGGRDLNDKNTFIFNFPRSTEGISYKAIESVKDGLMTSTKYESATLVFNCPHVICFSNELPDLYKLSEDRWNIKVIEDGRLVDKPI